MAKLASLGLGYGTNSNQLESLAVQNESAIQLCIVMIKAGAHNRAN
jgi:hypothetical protein